MQRKYWAQLNLSGGINPLWPGHAAYPWGNTGHSAYSQAPVYLGEFGTGKSDADLSSATRRSQGQLYSFLCVIERGPLAVPPGSGPGHCGSTGPLPAPF